MWNFRITRLLIFLNLIYAAACDYFSQQPRISSNNGHVVFLTAENRNITFKQIGSGSIRLNDDDLVSIVETAKQTVQDLTKIKEEELATLHVRVQEIFEKIDKFELIAERVNHLETSVATLTSLVQNSTRRFVTLNNRVISNRNRVRNLQRQLSAVKIILNKDECTSNPCRNGGKCEDAYNGYVCRCPDNWQGATCEEDVNECSLYSGTPQGCQNGATCVNLVGSFQCNCAANWRGVHCNEKHDDCTGASSQELCGHGICVNLERVQPGLPKYECICDAGWTKSVGSNPACIVDVDECAWDRYPCSVNPKTICSNTQGSYFCHPCPTGYTGNGHVCEDVNECLVNNGGCSMSPMVLCENVVGSRRCGSCPQGYQGDGVTCTQYNMCLMNNGGCSPLAVCIANAAMVGGRECRCGIGYFGSGVGPHGCSVIDGAQTSGPGVFQNPCDVNPCVHGTCSVYGYSYHCTCQQGYIGINCDSQLNPCLSHPCLNAGTCTPNGMEYTCTCASGFTGTTCQDQQEGCGGDLYGDSGNIAYPIYQGTDYEHNRDCTWIISTSTWGKVVNLTFHLFHLEGVSGCPYDFLQINDGYTLTSNLIGHFCGTELPKGGQIIGTSNSMRLWFHSDHSQAGTGFSLTWGATDPECGEKIEAEYGIIQTPGYPGNYPLSHDCYWLVTVPAGKKINFQFHTLKLEEHFNCSYDYLIIHNGLQTTDPTIARYCQTYAPAPLTTPGQNALLHFHSDEINTDSGFHITFTSIPGVPGCGGEITDPHGFFTSPGYPHEHPHNLECDWHITSHDGERIKLTFLYMDLEEHPACFYDYLDVWDGPNTQSGYISRYCGKTIPPPIYSSSNHLYIKFQTDPSESFTGFRAEYELLCGGIFADPTGTIHSPYYPNPYPESRECFYLIKQQPGTAIVLEFEDFDVEGDYVNDEECIYDYLEIRDGHDERAPLRAKLCGLKSPEPIVSSQNVLWLKFVTDNSQQNKGFLANYRTEEIVCGGVYLNQMNGTIYSPDHPMPYPGNSLCVWIIQVPVHHVIDLTFDNFHLEGSTGNCYYDFVEIFDNVTILNKSSHSMGKFCGPTIPAPITTMGDLMTIVFQSDVADSYDGFTATFNAIDSSLSCGGNFTSSAGFIRSPNYPNGYSNYEDCTWVIRMPTMQQIEINITDIDLEEHPDCDYDYLEIRNGGSESSPLIGRYCGQNKIPGLIKSYGNQMYIHFHSDHSNTYKGFHLLWDGTLIGCTGILMAASGTLTSPNYPDPYDHNVLCEWQLAVSHGNRIKIIINDLDMEELEGCNYDYLEIVEKGASGKRTKFCGTEVPTDPILTGSNVIKIHFKSDVSHNGRGFSLRFETECNNNIQRGSSGVIESPNFPYAYPHLQDCTWNITAPWGNKIHLVFSYIDIEPGTNCSYDKLEIRDNTEPPKIVATYCSMRIPPNPILSDSEGLTIKFLSDADAAHTGFRLEWSIIGCGGTFNNRMEGNFSYPDDEKHLSRVVCEWYISVDYGHQVKLTIDKFDLDFSSCEGNSLQVFGGPDDTSPSLTSPLCHRSTNPIILTAMGNHMFIRYKRLLSPKGSGFSAVWEAIEGGCSQEFLSPTGVIHTPNYPNNYNDQDDCSWLIVVEDFHTIALTFQDFQLEEVENCTFDYVAIYDGDSDASKRIFFYCGEQTPTTLLRSSSNKMYIRFKADPSQPRRGFYANYSMDCGGSLNAYEGGIISISPSFITYSYSPNCIWLIKAENPGDRVTFAISELRILDSRRRGWNCSMGSLTVYDGYDEFAQERGKYCRFDAPAPITSEGSALYVVLTKGQNHSESNFYANSISFIASYYEASSMCGGNYTSVMGAFSSPGYPDSYYFDMECEWYIKAPPGNRVQLSFIAFDLEDSENCNYDYLEIHEKNAAGKLLGTFCGNDLPSNFTASESFWIKFRSNEEGTGQGFMARYSLLFGNEIYADEGEIASPFYPHFSTINGIFKWHIVVTQGMRIQVEFKDFSYNRTVFKSLTLYDGGDENSYVLARLNGVNLPEPVYTWGNELFIVYPSAHFSQCRFFLSWKAIYDVPPTEHSWQTWAPWTTSNSDVAGCGGTVYIGGEISTNITSPGYPHGYTRYLNCVWIIQTDVGHHLTAKFVHLDLLDYYYECYYDSIKIFDGEKGTQEWGDTPLGSVCRREAEGTYLNSTSHFMKIEFRSGYDNRTGFLIQVESVCGGFLTGGLGFIRSPGYPNPYPANQNCEWSVSVKPGRTILIRGPSSFDVEASDACTDDYILFRNGATKDSPLLGHGKYCNSEKLPALNSTSNHLFIKFVSDNKGSNNGFLIMYEEESINCGGNVILSPTVTQHEFKTPNFPRIPPPHTECKWIFMAPASHRVQLDFDSTFDITDKDNCSTEYVEGFDGGTINSPIVFKKCGKEAPETMWSTGNTMLVRYFTDTENEGSGFKANAKIAVCGGTFVGKQGSIVSPEYPNAYTSNLNCEWKVRGPIGHYISFLPVNYDLPHSYNCSLGTHVSVRDYDEKELATFCSHMYQTPVAVNTSDNQGSVHFASSVNTEQYKGFKFTYNASVDSCGGEVTTPSGVVTSPNYPGVYAHRQRCFWEIIVPKGRRIRIEFTYFNLEGQSLYYNDQWNCADQIMMFDGTSGYSPRLTATSLCGDTLPPVYKTSGNELGLYFFTDGDNTGGGFSFTYTSDEPAVCGGDITSFPKVISSPFGPDVENDSIHCIWEINNPSDVNNTLVFNVTDFKTAPRFSVDFQCFHAFLKILTASELADSQLVHDLCGNLTDTVYVVPFNNVWLRYKKSMGDNKTEGFNLTYTVQSCGGVITDQDFSVVTPNYPNNYGSDAHCAWAIVVEEEMQIQLTFEEFNLDENSKDYIVVYNGLYPAISPKFGIFNSTHKPSTLRSMGNSLWIEFHSDNVGNAKGFKATGSAIASGCTGHFHANIGTLTSLNFPNKYPNDVECEWEVAMWQGYFGVITFVDRFDIQTDDSCSKDFVAVYEKVENEWQQIGSNLCGKELPKPILTERNVFKVVFRTDDNVNGDGFKLTWTKSCGGVFNESSGKIYSPGFPGEYGTRLRCDYLIMTEPQHYLRLDFDENFDIENETNCMWDSIEIFNGNNDRAMSLGKYCGNEAPGPFISKGTIFIRFISDSIVVKNGFILKYEVQECGGNYTGANGTLKTPTHPVSYLPSTSCTWVIKGTENLIIELVFLHIDMEDYGCMYDYVRIYDGNSIHSPVIKTLCGIKTKPEIIHATSDVVTVYFRSDDVIHQTGFFATYRSTYGEKQGCGGYKNTSTGSISSLDYDNDGEYEPGLTCVWVIETLEHHKVLKLTVDKFDVEAPEDVEKGCPWDYLEIRDGLFDTSRLINRFCGTEIPKVITSSGKSLWIKFVSDSYHNKAGFQISYISIEAPCSDNLVATNYTKELKSPDYPYDYPPNTRCEWNITADREGSIEIIFQDFELENSTKCSKDYLEVRDQPDYPLYNYFGPGNLHLEGAYCGKEIPHHFVSFVPKIRLNFVSDDTHSGVGFKLKYRLAGCNQSYGPEDDHGRIRFSLNNFLQSDSCIVSISAKEDRTIALYFTYFTITFSHNCTEGYMKVFDGKTVSDNELQSTCGSYVPYSIFSTGSDLLIVFKPPGTYSRNYIDIMFTTTDQGIGCGGTVAGTNGSFTSPFYPFNYTSDKECQWLIQVPPAGVVELTFLRINYFTGSYEYYGQVSSDDCKPHISVYDGREAVLSKRLAHYCYSSYHTEVRGSTNEMLVTFQSTMNNTGDGFRAVFSTSSWQEIIPETIPKD